MNNSPQILVTGFQPFLGEKINPSEILLEWIQKDFASAGVDTLLLPVSFHEAPELILKKATEKNYDHILMLGQAGGRNKVSFERVALNWTETSHPDEYGFMPQRGKIFEQNAEAFFTQSPIEIWKDGLIKSGHHVEISLNAGGYVCNYIYYKILHHIQQNNLKSKACFIHVPYLPEQTASKSPAPASMELDAMKNILLFVLDRVRN
ncbi:pyroglutamyl-peptidase I [Bdellovibrio reynosensis]|uniref:Pyroglutamyl-peptidase I n=1 Tax=Bdellovibrio reynosensis TaxID=2835041 RepID=A0ABY4CGJ1_9BACT|nr:pyroglutamyl-peptidase I [Bdellovibrio reynosensis]UOF02921.1 pyroglutamyl-peptidase I [Bdellovibrio reynosensis]